MMAPYFDQNYHYLYYLQLMRAQRGQSYQPKLSKQSQQTKKKQGITFVIVSQGEFAINIPFAINTSALKDIMRNFSVSWNVSPHRLWIGPRKHYLSCLAAFQNHFDSIEDAPALNKIPEFVLKAEVQMPLELMIKNNYSTLKTIQYSNLEKSINPKDMPFYSKLYDFQKQSLEFGISKHGRLLLGDEMGVGKTIQSLAIVSIFRHQWPFVVICPSSLRLNWQQQILNWMGDFVSKHEVQVYIKGNTPIRENIKAFIISYDMAWKMKEQLELFKVAIADEAHYLKNTGSKRSDFLCPFLTSRKRVILLSGTPALARPRQIFNLISVIRPDIFYHFKEFGYRYCDPTYNHWSRSMEYNGCQNSPQLYYLLKNKIMIRRLKKQVLTMLPDKQRQKISVETDKSVIKQIKQLLNNNGMGGKNMQKLVMESLFNFDDGNQEMEDTRRAITQAYTLTGRAKLQATKQYISQMLENDIKIIVFGHHLQVLDGIQEMLVQKKYPFMRIDGSVSKQKRHQNVVQFQQNPKIKVALLSITAAGVGLTLTAASTVIFAELHWTPGTMVQAEDRAHRIGQKNSVNCHYLIGEGTLDDILYPYLLKKVQNVSSFIEGKTQRMQMENLSKGEKGKVSNQNSNTTKTNKPMNILFKFQSSKPLIDKYFLNEENTGTQISDDQPRYFQTSPTKSNCIKKQPPLLQQIVSNSKEELFSDKKILEKSEQQKESNELGEFIKENVAQIFTYSQENEWDQTQSVGENNDN